MRTDPFSLLGLDWDNGSQVINQHLYSYCRREGITFTRSRSYKKNDSCHVAQKNWSVVRRLIGYDQYNSRTALEALNHTYLLLKQINENLEHLWNLTEHPAHQHRQAKTYEVSVT